MQTVKIALIDSGIKEGALPSFINKESVEGGFAIYGDSKESIRITQCRPDDINGHGTACAIAINRIAPNAKIIPISVLDEDGRCNVERLIAALHLIQCLDVSIVSMSLSSSDFRRHKKLYEAINDLNKQNKICISSKSNDRWLSYPAFFNNVIGVKGNNAIFNFGYKYEGNKKIQVVASSAAELPQYHIGEMKFFRGNSKATAIVSGIVADAIERKMIKNGEIERYLVRNSWDDIRLFKPIDNNWDNNISKEVHKCILKLIDAKRIQVNIKEGGVLTYSNSRIEDYYEIITCLESNFGCRMFKKNAVYRSYFESVNMLSKLVESAVHG